MYVKVAQLFEPGGIRLPRHRAVTLQPSAVGCLKLCEEYSTDFRRNVVYAILSGPVGEDVLPRLHDAVVRWIGDGAMTIGGFEYDTLTRACTAQSWYVVMQEQARA